MTYRLRTLEVSSPICNLDSNFTMKLIVLDVSLLLLQYKCKLSLLLTISQSRPGATEVLNAGLFPAIRAAGIFSVDPDVGLGRSSHLQLSTRANCVRNGQYSSAT